jgi:DNA modification methylase
VSRTEVIGRATLHLGDCRDILPTLGRVDAVISDPPYPNGEGHFVDAVDAAREVMRSPIAPIAMWFWSEVDVPAVNLPWVATHIWHRTNVNGKIYEPILHFAKDSIKRRSEIKAHAAVFNGVGPGCNEYEGHPTQKPVALMRWLIDKSKSAQVILDPFMGSGTTGVAAVQMQRNFIGIEREPAYFEIACRRIEDAQRQGSLFDEVAA